MMLLLILQAKTAFEWGDVFVYGPTAVLLFLVLFTIIKLAPTWKEVKLKELELKKADGETREKEAAALSQLATVLQSIAVEQRRATDSMEIMQRVGADASDKLTMTVHTLNERLDRVEQLGFQNIKEVTQQLATRVEKLEQTYVESPATKP